MFHRRLLADFRWKSIDFVDALTAPKGAVLLWVVIVGSAVGSRREFSRIEENKCNFYRKKEIPQALDLQGFAEFLLARPGGAHCCSLKQLT